MSSLAAGAVGVLTARIVALAASLVASAITARTLGPEGRGQYYFAVMLGALAIQFGTMGLHASNTYIAAHNRLRAGALLTNSVWVSVAAGAVVIACVSTTVMAGRLTTDRVASLYWIALYVPAGLFIQLANSVLLGCGEVRWYNISQVAVSVVTTILVLVSAMVLAREPHSFVAALAIGNLSVAAAMLIAMRGMTTRRWRFDMSAFRQGWHFAAKSFAVSILGFIVLRTNVFLIERLHTPAELGFYSVAMQFLDVISLMPASIATILFPALVGSSSAWSDTKRHVLLVFGLVSIACLVFAAVLEPLILFVFGAPFLEARRSVLLLLPAAVFVGATTIFSQYLAAKGLPMSVLVVWTSAALIGAGCGYVLIPGFGAAGASIGLSITYGATALHMGVLALLRSRNVFQTAD